MPRPVYKLSQVQIGRALKRQCTLNDGGGLYFVSRPPNGASWIFRFSRHGKDRWMGIGQYPTVTLGDAHARRDVDQMTLHQMRAADQINEAARKGSRRLRLRLTG